MVFIYFAVTMTLHLAALTAPLFFDFSSLPGYIALYLLISLVTSVPTAWMKSLRPWHLAAFWPVLFAAEEGFLFILRGLSASGGTLKTHAVVAPEEFFNAIAGTGVYASLTSWFVTALVLIVSIVLKRQREILSVHRIVDTEDEWNRVYRFMESGDATDGISPFHWRLLRARTFCYIAEQADRIEASLLLIPGNPGTAYLSDFVMSQMETGAELLGAVLNRPELRNCERIFLVDRHSQQTAGETLRHEASLFLFGQLIQEERRLPIPSGTDDFLENFSPDGSRLRPFAKARIVAAARGETEQTL